MRGGKSQSQRHGAVADAEREMHLCPAAGTPEGQFRLGQARGAALREDQRGGGEEFAARVGIRLRREVGGDEVGGGAAGREFRVLEAADEEGLVGGDPERRRLAQGGDELLPRRVARGAVGDNLRQQRVVVGSDLAAGLHAGIDAHACR